MCGILGIVGPPGSAIDLGQVREALTRIRHRGPDDEGYLLANTLRDVTIACGGEDTDRRLSLPDVRGVGREAFNVALGHRRLSILDLSPAGHQPMASADGSRWMVFNGEIYNYLELREELAKLGHSFRTGTDTEVILAAYGEWRSGMLPKLIGMFALVIVDLRAGTVFAARDHFGIKPLYYAFRGKQLVFGSEIKALLGLEGVRRNVNPGRLYDYLLFGLSDFGGETLFAAVNQLPAAHFMEGPLEWLEELRPRRYWRLDLSRRSECSFEEAAAAVGDVLAASVRLHMRSDVPVGSCLSGGLDSSAIVAHMRRIAGREGRIHTFTYVADDPVLGEERFADLVSEREATTPHKTRPTPEDMTADFDRLVYVQDEPFAGTSIYAQLKVFELAHETGMKVMLDGQGADELFAGYLYLLGARASGLLAQGRFVSAYRVARGAPRNQSASMYRMIGSTFGRLLPDYAVRTARMAIGESLRPRWLTWSWFEERGVATHQHQQGHGQESLREELLLSVESLTLPQLLRYEDRNSMAHSIESRVPFCIAAVAELALSLPAEYLVRGDGTTKAVLREAVREIVPQEILAREKVGFAVPERKWLAALGPWVAQSLETMSHLPFLDVQHLRRTTTAALGGVGHVAGVPWRCLNVAQWASAFSVATGD